MKHIDIARQLNISTATVSNALSGKGRMSEELRNRIIQIAEAGGYVRKSKPTNTGKRTVNIVVEQLSVDFCHRILTGMCRAAREHQITLQIYDMSIVDYGYGISPPEEWLSDYIRNFLKNVDNSALGMLYVSQYTRDVSGILPKLPYPVVYAYCCPDDASISVNIDDEQGAYLATSHLLEKGCQSPAMICGPINNIPTSNRYIGYQRAIIDHGLTLDPTMICIKDWGIDDGYRAMKELIGSGKIPDAIFAHNDHLALGAIRAATEAGIKVPDQLSVVGIDNIFSAYTTPAITTIAPPFEELGNTAFETLLQISSGVLPVNKKRLLPCSLILRDSG
ncbi:LacI family DNA-binding transcriptional regulator [Massiliimalia massiliensis]|uniref:LacI family DNA-binding transcriptional regulator n=1 Tax=Massiliimalia massiliensis TaxID=1852384 RepID=UPI00098512E3|nr:LacI family DNA-binding transcriptional regulator [Massiliimalia massiliensis]